MRTHVCQTASRCFAALRQRSIRHLFSATVFQSLVAAVVLCRLDYVSSWSPSLLYPSTAVASRFRVQRPGSYSGWVVLTTLQFPTGYECGKRSCSKSLCKLTWRCMVIDAVQYLRRSSRPSPTPRFDKDSATPPPIICLFPLLNSLLLDIIRGFLKCYALYKSTFYLLYLLTYLCRAYPVAGARIYGTIYRWTLPPHRRRLHSSID